MDKRIGQLLRTCIWLNLFFFTGQSLAADFEPILSLPPASSEVPLLNETLRDPSLQSSKITDDIYAQKTLEEIDALTKELTLAKSSRRLEVLADLYQNYARLSYFYEDVLTGRVAVQDNYGALTQKVKAARSAVNTYANEYSKISKNASGQALYLISVTKFLSDDTNNLELPLSMSKKLTKAQKSRLKLMLALNKIKKNDSSAIQDLSGMRTQMGREGAVAINLVLAKFEASRGHEAYRSYISHATAAAKPLQRPDRERILGFGLRVWKLGEKDKGDWNNVPLNLKLHRDLEITKAIAERSGLQFTDQGKYAPALSFYRSMIESSQGSPRLANVLDRVIELEAAQYQKSKIVGPYQKSLIAGQDILSREGSLGASQTNLAQASSERIRLRHRQLISQLLTTAKQSSTSPKDRIEAINAAKIYLNGSALEAEKIPLSTDIGRVYAINDQHAEAVKIFMELKGQVQGTASQQFLLLAMQSQMVLAKWSPKEAWTLYPVALQKSSRSTLADMYSEKFQFTASWDDLAQLGLLYVNLGQATKAYGLWTAQLAKNTKSESAQLATGMMMNTYKKVRRWQKLEDLARLSIKAQLIPIFQNQRLDAIALLGDALFENGKEQFAASRYPQAISKLAEFTRNYKTDFRRPEGMFVLGQSYHLGNKHTLSVE
ncbi:MAG: hypothetical protein NTX25_18565, partial [Proteobacteria bacterium]|nr:hypothetical protein [Pseudomonadota bacterium]